MTQKNCYFTIFTLLLKTAVLFFHLFIIFFNRSIYSALFSPMSSLAFCHRNFHHHRVVINLYRICLMDQAVHRIFCCNNYCKSVSWLYGISCRIEIYTVIVIFAFFKLDTVSVLSPAHNLLQDYTDLQMHV